MCSGSQRVSDGACGRRIVGDDAGRRLDRCGSAIRAVQIMVAKGKEYAGLSYTLSQYARDVDAHPDGCFAPRDRTSVCPGGAGGAVTPSHTAARSECETSGPALA